MPDNGYPKDSPLQIFPKGLLGGLELKNGGEFPQRLTTDLVPTLELVQWYAESNAERIIVRFAASPAAFRAVGAAVPLTEMWLVTHLTGYLTNNAAAGGITSGTSYSNNGLQSFHPRGETGRQLGAPAVIDHVACKIDRWFLAFPGETIGVQGAFGGNADLDIHASWLRLKL